MADDDLKNIPTLDDVVVAGDPNKAVTGDIDVEDLDTIKSFDALFDDQNEDSDINQKSDADSSDENNHADEESVFTENSDEKNTGLEANDEALFDTDNFEENFSGHTETEQDLPDDGTPDEYTTETEVIDKTSRDDLSADDDTREDNTSEDESDDESSENEYSIVASHHDDELAKDIELSETEYFDGVSEISDTTFERDRNTESVDPDSVAVIAEDKPLTGSMDGDVFDETRIDETENPDEDSLIDPATDDQILFDQSFEEEKIISDESHDENIGSKLSSPSPIEMNRLVDNVLQKIMPELESQIRILILTSIEKHLPDAIPGADEEEIPEADQEL